MMSEVTETALIATSLESETKSENMESKSEETPLLSPGENEVSGNVLPQAQADERPTSIPSAPPEPQDSFKRPMIGPLRKSSSNIKRKTYDDKSQTKSEVELAPDENYRSKTTVEADISTDKNQPGDDTKPKAPPSIDKETTENIETTKKASPLSPAEQLKQTQKSIPYLEPKWGGPTEKDYSLEVLKNGSIIDNVQLTEKSFYVFGRLPACDVQLEHPSLSRYHAVLQYCSVPNDEHEIGWYLYDLESTHGTTINKLQVKPRVFYRVRVGFVLKFAGSSRLHILQGPDEDQEAESELTVTEMKEQREQHKQEEELAEKLNETESETSKDEDTGCSWGMADDAVNAEAETPIIDLLPKDEELYIDDPKKALKGFFEREGYDLPEYQFEEAGHGKHKCVVEVPVDSPTGQPVYAEAVVAGKRKDAVVACALEACRILDRYGLLRKKEHEARKAKTRDWEENDYYGSDEDEFLDRTGEIQKKRELRMKRAGKLTEKAETYESLTSKLEEVVTEMDKIEKQLEEAKKDAAVADTADLDALDAYMSSIKKGAIDTKTRMSLKRRLFDLKKERGHLERLVNIAKPALLPKTSSGLKLGQMSGRIGGFSRKIGGTGRGRSVLPITMKAASQPKNTTAEKTKVTEEVDSDEGEPEKTKVTQQTQEEPLKISQTESAKAVEQSQHLEQMKAPEEENGKSQKADREQSSETTAYGVQDSGQTKIEQLTRAEQAETRLSEDETLDDVKASTKGQDNVQTPKSQSKPDSGTTKSSSDDIAQLNSGLGSTRKRLADAQKVKPKKSKIAPLSKDYATDDPDYAVWVPPAGQTGDGKTHLNAKYGY